MTKRTEMVLHKVGVLGKVDGLEGELAQTLAAIDVLLLLRGNTRASGLAAMFTIEESKEK